MAGAGRGLRARAGGAAGPEGEPGFAGFGRAAGEAGASTHAEGMDGAQELEIVVAGRSVHGVRRAGGPEAGLPLVLVHGLACSSAVYGPLLRHLAVREPGREAVALDMPGYGGSRAGWTLDIPELADWYAEALTVLGIERAHVVGHSMGCQVALALARRAPGRVASVTLIGPTTGSEGQRLARYAVGLALDAVFESPRYNLTLLRMWSQMRLRRYFATVPFMLRDRPIALASQVRCPVLVVRGQRDCIVPARAVRRLVAALPEGRWVEVPAVAHAVQFDRPEQFGDLLLPFVARAEGERRDELSDAGRR